MLSLDAELLHAAVEVVQALLALRAADDLADAWRQHVHRGNGFAVVVQTHVERFDLLGIVGHHHRPADVFLGQPALVFGLQIQAPFDREVEAAPGIAQQLDRSAVVDAFEWFSDEFLQSGQRIRLHALGDERHVVGTLVEHRAKHIFQECLGKIGVVVEIGEREFGLDHPELGQMSRGIGILGAEGRAEGVDLRHRQTVRLDVELAGYSEEGFLAEEILVEGNLAVGAARQVRQIQRGDAKHLPRAFGIRSGDDRRIDPEVAILVEETVDRLRQAVADTGHCAEQVGARTQVRDFAQEFQRMRFRLDRVGFRIFDAADQFDRCGLDLECLPLALRWRQCAGRDHRAASGQMLDHRFVIRQRGGRDDLDRREARTIAQVDERQSCLGIAACAHPATHRHCVAGGATPRENIRHAYYRHARTSTGLGLAARQRHGRMPAATGS